MENSDRSLLPSGFGMRPRLIQAHGSRKQTQTMVDVLDRSSHEVIVPEMQSKICLGTVYDGSWLLMLDEDTLECFLLSFTDRRSKICLPPLRLPPASDYRGATCGVMGSPANFTVVLTSDGESEQRFWLCCRPGDEEWTDLLATVDGLVWPPGSSVSHAGKLYAGNLEVMDYDIGGAVRNQSLRTGGDKVGMYGTTARHLVVSDGDIFVVLIEYVGRHYDGSLTRIVVRRLDLSSLVWTTVESIGRDRVFLLSSDSGLSSSAAAAQLQGNCIYLVWSSCDCERLYKFCLDDMTKSFHQILPQPTTPCSRAYWVVSDDIQDTLFKGQALLSAVTSNEVTQPNDLDSQPEEQKGVSWPPWHDLQLELLDLIASKLALVDRIRFPAVCKRWSMVSSPIVQAQVWPWLMHISKQDGTCKMFDPLRGKQHTLQVEALKSNSYGHILRSSKNGWVVTSARRNNDEICFIINPFTQDIVEVPMLGDEMFTITLNRFHGITLSSTPTSPDSIVFGVCSSTNGKFLRMQTWWHGEDLWSDEYHFEHEEDPFPIAYNNPVYFRGEFYCLGRKGNLGVFNPSDGTWRVLEKPKPIYTELQVWDDDHDGAKFCYLVDLGGDLVSVFMRNADEPPRVFMLDQMKTMEWVEMKDDIGGAALFVDYRASFGILSPGAGNGNRIYFPSYSEDGKHAAFYDMETKAYHPEFYGVKEPLNCVWLVPNLGTSR